MSMKNKHKYILFACGIILSGSSAMAQHLVDTAKVDVAFRRESAQNLSGAVSAVDLEKRSETMYSLYSLEDVQSYTGGYNGSLWGYGSYLVLVDGVPRNANNVMPSEIKSISLLKGASAVALYGSRAAKGVVLISTKRGSADKNGINVSVNTGYYVPKRYPSYMGAAEYMAFYNEARLNDGLDPLYSDEEIYNTAEAVNRYRWPNTKFYTSDHLKKMYNRTDAVAEIYGGAKRARYYTNIGYQTSGTLFKIGEAANDRTNRFNVRGNVDVDVTSFIKAHIDANATFYDNRSAHGDYWNMAATCRPNRFSLYVPLEYIASDDEELWTLVNNANHIIDGKYLLGGSQLDQGNAIADMYAAGYNKYISRQFQFDAGVDVDLHHLLQGLDLRTNFAIDYATSYNQSYDNTYSVYEAKWTNYLGGDTIGELSKYGTDKKSGVQNVSGSWYRQTMLFNAVLDWKRHIGRGDLRVMFLANGWQQSESAVYHKTSNANLGVFAKYSLDNKYFAEFSGAVVHSAKLPKGNRNALSPVLTLGWEVSKEDFLKSSRWIDNLKLTASAGIINTDLDIDDYYMYEGIYSQTDGTWWGWNDGKVEQSTDSKRGTNPELGFVKRKEVRLGLETSMFKGALFTRIDWFRNVMDGLLAQPASIYPSYFYTYYPKSSFIPYVNYNKDLRTGLDFTVEFAKRFGDFAIEAGVSGMIYNSKALKRDENNEYDYQNKQGKALDGLWGLRSAGFYADQNDIDQSPVSSYGEVKPGDIKYIDQNGDGIIDDTDEVFLGKAGWNGAPFTMGSNLTLRWKRLALTTLFTGSFGAYAMKDNDYYQIQGDVKYSIEARYRWTSANSDSAKYPRLTTKTSDNNTHASDFWMYSTSRFDLAKVQLSYDIPAGVFGWDFIKGATLYVGGFDLLTFSKEREVLELSIGSSPQKRFYNCGLKVQF